jgi:hypothetical protein
MALITDLGVDGNGILQPMLKNRWKLNFLGIAGDPDPLRVQAVSCDRPKLEFDEVTLDRYNSRAYVAGKHSFQPMNIVIESDVGGTVANSIQQQLNLQQSIIGNFPAPVLPAAIGGAIYKFAIRQDMYGGDNSTILESWIMEGCWFQQVDWENLDYSTSEQVRITCVVRFDQAREIITGVAVKATGGAGVAA